MSRIKLPEIKQTRGKSMGARIDEELKPALYAIRADYEREHQETVSLSAIVSHYFRKGLEHEAPQYLNQTA
jgi:peptide subunit release factor RF-3